MITFGTKKQRVRKQARNPFRACLGIPDFWNHNRLWIYEPFTHKKSAPKKARTKFMLELQRDNIFIKLIGCKHNWCFVKE